MAKKQIKSVFRKIGGILLLITILSIMWTIASIPTYLIAPQTRFGDTMCYFLFLSIFLAEFIVFVLMLSTYAKRK